MAKRNITELSFRWYANSIAGVQVDCTIQLDDELFPDEFKERHYAAEREQFPVWLETIAVELETGTKQFVKSQETMPDGS